MTRFKNIDLKVKDIDEQNRKVLIYVSEFNSKDSDGDIILPGAYTKTISERGPMSAKPRIKHFRDHWDLVGKPLEMTQDSKGLLVLSQISNSTLGKDLIEDYKLNLMEHSIGFETIKEDRTMFDGANALTELKLWEYSSVTWGANENTPLVEMKGYSKEEILQRINSKMDQLANAIRKGDYTDERFEALEFQLQTIKTSYNDYINALVKPLKSTPEPDLKAFEDLFSNLNKRLQNGK